MPRSCGRIKLALYGALLFTFMMTSPVRAAPVMAQEETLPSGGVSTFSAENDVDNHASNPRTHYQAKSLSRFPDSHRQTVETSSPVEEPKCNPDDRVVWVNDRSGIYHYRYSKWYGHTRSGYYACEKAALAGGNRVSHSRYE